MKSLIWSLVQALGLASSAPYPWPRPAISSTRPCAMWPAAIAHAPTICARWQPNKASPCIRWNSMCFRKTLPLPALRPLSVSMAVSMS